MEVNIKKIGLKIRGLRAEARMLSSELAEKIDRSESWVCRLERGEISDVGVVLLTKIAKELGRTREQLIEESKRVQVGE